MKGDRKCSNCGAIIPGDSEFCPFCGNKISYISITDNIINTRSESKKKLVIILLAVVCALLLAGNIIQWYQSYLNVDVIRNSDSNNIFRSINSIYHINSLGYAAKNFKSSDALVFLKEGETSTISLTAYWDDFADVYTSQSNDDVCTITFADLSWEKEVNIRIRGEKPGTSLVTFRNTSDNNFFSIVVVVVES